MTGSWANPRYRPCRAGAGGRRGCSRVKKAANVNNPNPRIDSPDDVKERLLSYARQLGPLRLTLAALAIISIALMPPPRTPIAYDSWGFIYTVVMPVLAPLVFMVLMLDLLMSRVFMSATDDTQRNRYRLISLVNLVLGIGILIRFLPFLLALSR